MKFSFRSLCLALWALAILPAIMMWVATALSLVSPIIVIPALYGIFVAPAIYVWYNYKKKEGILPFKGFKIRSPEQVIAEYMELSTKSGERSKKQNATS